MGCNGGLHAAALPAVDPEIGGLAEYRHIWPDTFLLDEMAHAVSVAVLFHHRRRQVEGHAVGYSAVGQDLCAVGHSRNGRQFVNSYPAPYLSIFELPGKGI